MAQDRTRDEEPPDDAATVRQRAPSDTDIGAPTGTYAPVDTPTIAARPLQPPDDEPPTVITSTVGADHDPNDPGYVTPHDVPPGYRSAPNQQPDGQQLGYQQAGDQRPSYGQPGYPQVHLGVADPEGYPEQPGYPEQFGYPEQPGPAHDPDPAPTQPAPTQPAPTGEQRAGDAGGDTQPTDYPLGGSLLRRHRRQTITFGVALAAVLVVGAGAYGVYRDTITWPFGGGPGQTTSVCPTQAPAIQAAGATRVRVYNASSRRGLALSVSRELQKRGFKVPTVGNDPMESKPATAAVIRYGPAALMAAHTIGTQVDGTVSYQPDDRIGEVVDLVLSPTFGLIDAKKGLAALKATPKPIAGCPSSQ